MANYYEDFAERLRTSKPAVIAVARYLNRKYPVRVPPTILAPNVHVMEQYKDDGDIHIIRNDHLERIEVKGSSRPFTSCNNYPYQNICIVKKDRHDQLVLAHRIPLAYFIVNNECTHAAVIDCRHNATWFVDDITDTKRDHTYDCYWINKHEVNFVCLNQMAQAA